MSEATTPAFARQYAAVLAARVGEPQHFLHKVAGSRQVGKTPIVQQVLAQLDRARPTARVRWSC